MIVLAPARSASVTACSSSGTLAARAYPIPYRRAASANGRPWGVATCSSKASRCPATGRKWKIPPPSLLSSTTTSASPSRRAASSPPISWASATSPISSTTGLSPAAAAPNALETVPSIPLAPRFESTRGASSWAAKNSSTSRIGIEEATNSVAEPGSHSPSRRATSGSESRSPSVASIARAAASSAARHRASQSGSRGVAGAAARSVAAGSPPNTAHREAEGSCHACSGSSAI